MKTSNTYKSIILALIVGLIVMGMGLSSIAQEKTTLTFWSLAGPDKGSRESGNREIWKTFEEQNPNLEIDDIYFPWNEFIRKLNIAIGTNSAPDIIQVDAPLVPSYVINDALLPLDNYLTKERVNEYLETSIQNGSVNGHIYALPGNESAVVMMVNTEMLKEVGVDPADIPRDPNNAWSFDDWWPIWKKLTRDTNGDGRTDVYGVGIRQSLSAYPSLQFVLSAGEPGSPTYMGISPDGLEVDGYLNTEEAMEAWKFIGKQYSEGVKNKTPIPEVYETGRAATYIHSGHIAQNLENNYPEMYEKTIFVSPPYFNTPTSFTGSLMYGVSANTDHPDAAAKAVKFATSRQGSEILFSHNGEIPARKDHLNDLERFAEGNKRHVSKRVLEEIGRARPRTPGYTEYGWSSVSETLNDIKDGANPEKRVSEMIKKLDKALDKYEDWREEIAGKFSEYKKEANWWKND